MHSVNYILQLTDDVVLSRNAATAGEHETLDYVPGSALLGAAAALLYKTLKADQKAFEAFHSGAVRFGNALPCSQGEQGLPMPLCWHERKGDSAVRNGRIDAAKIRNFQTASFADHEQPAQLRGGYVTPSGRVLQPEITYRMKTAVDPAVGRAANGQLFGYASVRAGSLFCGQIDADDRELLERIRAALANAGSIRIGRSRATEYGRAQLAMGHISEITAPDCTGATEITLWLRSDMAVRNQAGAPSLHPLPQWLGLPHGTLDAARSFVRVRSYSPWNAKRRAHELERQVLQQGSVLHFRFDEGTSLGAEHVRTILGGLGDYREAGLGQVELQPEMLANIPGDAASPAVGPAEWWKEFGESFANGASREGPDGAAAGKELTALQSWVERQMALDETASAIEQWANERVESTKALYKSASRLSGTHIDALEPSSTQWSRVDAAARSLSLDGERADCMAKLCQALFSQPGATKDNDPAICKDSDVAWSTRTVSGDVEIDFRQWLRQEIEGFHRNAGITESQHPAAILRAVMMLADGIRTRPSGDTSTRTDGKSR